MAKIRNFALLLSIAGCAAMKPSVYGKSTEGSYGYVDRELGPKHYEIQVRGNQATTAYTLERYFHRRATELCGNDNYDSLIKHDKQTQIVDGVLTGYAYVPTTTNYMPLVSGDITCK